jgi:hypothetical protein
MVLGELVRSEYVVTKECGAGIPSIHTRADELSRPEVERMLAYFLRYEGIRTPLKFSWNKPGFVVHPA